MIYSCCIFVYCLFECFKPRNTQNYLLVFILVMFSGLVTTVYLLWKEPVFHQVMYGFLVGCLVLRSIYIVTWDIRQKVPFHILGALTQFHAWWHILTGLGSYLHILFSLYTRTLYLKYRPKVKFLLGVWPVILVEPPKSQ
uniref:Alkaline ceramidase n=1 Tax=Callorhinchus milii TaxID=7868 RepID=A0A4W3IKK5_CALMI